MTLKHFPWVYYMIICHVGPPWGHSGVHGTVARDEDIFANFFLLLTLFRKLGIGKLIYFTLIWLIFTPFFQYFEL